MNISIKLKALNQNRAFQRLVVHKQKKVSKCVVSINVTFFRLCFLFQYIQTGLSFLLMNSNNMSQTHTEALQQFCLLVYVIAVHFAAYSIFFPLAVSVDTRPQRRQNRTKSERR